MKTLRVPDWGLDACCGEWLLEPYISEFIDGGYGGVEDCSGRVVCKAEIINFQDGTQGVCLGEDVE